ncbi:TSUP family transporter [Flavobacterium sp. Fl-77]|uniref:Probable membrane transporter protein n=1 Tax=Flavobacterium flavipigmentatum TaxID=2893884 RepID=A0AAJ2VYI6_9FLAO|nr:MULTISPECIES: TSUP family transporter [unclassified Flavobacterium]MDX6183012.1 TSUP family transporter [Flavobacterium sp. Fl-33]MDX6186465.1 TSUP family transporter [Flavobacterium sp. Fl-77]UFH37751.1 TSUP family transporter [Flavobacterium sp. F-70]
METYIIFLLCLAAFAAGFIDAIVGGGGLIQTPMGLILLPNLPVSTVIGSLKIPAFSGTAFAAFQYLKKVVIQWKILLIMMLLAVPSAFLGSTLLTHVSNDFMKPLLLVVLSLLLVYTYAKKNFGQHEAKDMSPATQILYAVLISIVVGFYDGFIGPGTGSFLVVAFIALMGFDFLHASANAKMVNLATNFGSICLFLSKGKIIWAIAIPMAASNAFGGWLGAKLAINKGNGFIRIFFLVVVIGTLIRFAYDVFYK